MLLFDASVPRPIADALSLLKVELAYLTDRLPGNARDEEVVELAKAENAIIVTLDLDFTTRKQLFLDMAAKGVTVVVIRPPKGALMDQVAEIILWHHRS